MFETPLHSFDIAVAIIMNRFYFGGVCYWYGRFLMSIIFYHTFQRIIIGGLGSNGSFIQILRHYIGINMVIGNF